jgi:hypothetical protein
LSRLCDRSGGLAEGKALTAEERKDASTRGVSPKRGQCRARQRSHRVVLRGPAGRASCDGCVSPSSVVGLGRLCDLCSLVDWFCDMAQKPPMTCEKITPSASKPVLGGCCFSGGVVRCDASAESSAELKLLQCLLCTLRTTRPTTATIPANTSIKVALST